MLKLINTTPENVRVIRDADGVSDDGEPEPSLRYPAEPERALVATLSYEEVAGLELHTNFHDEKGSVKAYRRGKFVVSTKMLVEAFPDGIPEEFGLIVTPTVALAKDSIEAVFGRPIRLFVPCCDSDSSLTTKRDSIWIDRNILTVRRLLEC